MNNQTPPPLAGYPQACAPSQPSAGAFTAPTSPAAPTTQPPPAAYAGVGTAGEGLSPTPAGPSSAYNPFPNDPTLILRRIDRDKISVSTEACHRYAIDPNRVTTFIKRCKNGAHFPPVVLFQQTDGSLLLVDGLHRLAAFDQIGVKIISAVVIGDLGQALVAGIRQNIPSNGTLRSGPDSMKSLCLLATALGRKITPPEAASLGLRFDDNHEVLSPTTLSLLTPLPRFAPGATAPAQPIGKPPTTPKKKAA